MWIRRADLLTPLTNITSDKSKLEWKEPQQEAFKKIKQIIAREILFSFPDFNKPFHIYTDASAY